MRSAIEVFGEWAQSGKDEKMADGHQLAVDHMLEFVLADRKDSFSMIDAGCGNGWVVRQIREHSLCSQALGIDGAEEMIKRAHRIDPEGEYYHADLLEWTPNKSVDLIHSMEVLYYFREPARVLKHMVDNWLKPSGTLIIGVDHYRENTVSLDWAEKHNIEFMTTLSLLEWEQAFISSGLIEVKQWQFAPKENWAGTLIITGQKK